MSVELVIVASATGAIISLVAALLGMRRKKLADVRLEVGKAVAPLRQEIKALSEQLATAQLAPKQPVPDTGDPLKIKAVEFFNAGFDAYKEGEVGQAIGHWLDALKLGPDFAYAHNNVGAALREKGDVDAAIEHLSAALRIEPDYAGAHSNLGIALIDKGERDTAIECFNAALRIDPEFAFAHSNLGVALQAKGEYDAAIERYSTALQIDSGYATAHFNIGCALAQKEDAAGAVAALGKAIELDPLWGDKAKQDSDYDPIRDDPAFRKLVYGE